MVKKVEIFYTETFRNTVYNLIDPPCVRIVVASFVIINRQGTVSENQ
jgi:hypothetical protein